MCVAGCVDDSVINGSRTVNFVYDCRSVWTRALPLTPLKFGRFCLSRLTCNCVALRNNDKQKKFGNNISSKIVSWYFYFLFYVFVGMASFVRSDTASVISLSFSINSLRCRGARVRYSLHENRRYHDECEETAKGVGGREEEKENAQSQSS